MYMYIDVYGLDLFWLLSVEVASLCTDICVYGKGHKKFPFHLHCGENNKENINDEENGVNFGDIHV